MVAFGITAQAGEKPPEDFVQVMKDLSVTLQDMIKGSGSQEMDVVTTSIQPAKDALEQVVKFWDARNDSSAAGLTKTAIKAVTDMGTAAELNSAEGVAFALTELRTACGGCHKAHREKLPDGSYEIK